QRHAGRCGASTGRVEGRLGALERVQEPRLVAHPPARPGQLLQVFGSDWLLGVSLEQSRSRHRPVVATVCRTTLVEQRLAAWHGDQSDRCPCMTILTTSPGAAWSTR